MDITTATTVSEDLSTAILSVDVDFTVEAEEEGSVQCVLTLLDNLGTETVAEDFSCKGQLEIQKPQLWWPYLMSETPGLNKEIISCILANLGTQLIVEDCLSCVSKELQFW